MLKIFRKIIRARLGKALGRLWPNSGWEQEEEWGIEFLNPKETAALEQAKAEFLEETAAVSTEEFKMENLGEADLDTNPVDSLSLTKFPENTENIEDWSGQDQDLRLGPGASLFHIRDNSLNSAKAQNSLPEAEKGPRATYQYLLDQMKRDMKNPPVSPGLNQIELTVSQDETLGGGRAAQKAGGQTEAGLSAPEAKTSADTNGASDVKEILENREIENETVVVVEGKNKPVLTAGQEKVLVNLQIKAENGLPEAQFALGRWYEDETLSSFDLESAINWYQQAAEQGHKGAKERLTYLAFRLPLTPERELIKPGLWDGGGKNAINRTLNPKRLASEKPEMPKLEARQTPALQPPLTNRPSLGLNLKCPEPQAQDLGPAKTRIVEIGKPEPAKEKKEILKAWPAETGQPKVEALKFMADKLKIERSQLKGDTVKLASVAPGRKLEKVGRWPKLLVCDVEGTIFKAQERIASVDFPTTMWHALARSLGQRGVEGEKLLAEKWERGKYENYLAWVHDTFLMHKELGLKKSQFDHILMKAEYLPGVETFFRNLDKRKYRPVLISGGFQELVDRARAELGIEDGYGACSYTFEEGTGILKTCRATSGDFEGKIDYLHCSLMQYGLDKKLDWVFIGDGKNDVYIALDAPVAIAINAHKDLRAAATHPCDLGGRVLENFDQIGEILESLTDADFNNARWRLEGLAPWQKKILRQMHDFLVEIGGLLALWLAKLLPKLSGTWWDDYVDYVAKYLVRRRQYEKARRAQDLTLLDLSVLVKIFENLEKRRLATQYRKINDAHSHLIYRIRDIRNDWSHVASGVLVFPDSTEIHDHLCALEKFLGIFGNLNNLRLKILSKKILRLKESLNI